MDLKHIYDLQTIIRELESCLSITASDYKENVEVIVDNVKRRLSRQYAIDLNIKISEMSSATGNISMLLDSLGFCHSKLAGLFQISRCYTHIPVNLNNVNYLGFSKTTMLELLSAMQVSKRRGDVITAIESVKAKLNKTTMSTEKRLFVLLIISYELGVTELYSCIAELLYFGGVTL